MYGTEIDLLHNLYNKINNYENAGAHNLVLENSLKLFELASTSPNDSIKVEYRCKSLFFSWIIIETEMVWSLTEYSKCLKMRFDQMFH